MKILMLLGFMEMIFQNKYKYFTLAYLNWFLSIRFPGILDVICYILFLICNKDVLLNEFVKFRFAFSYFDHHRHFNKA